MLKLILGSFERNGLCYRNFHTAAILNLKEIVHEKDGNRTTFVGKLVPSPREPYLLKFNEDRKDTACCVCRLPVEIKHTDVLILSQFVRSDGCMLPRRLTGLCNKQQKRMNVMVAMAKRAGLMPNQSSAFPKTDPSKGQHKKFNTYYDESTIRTWS